jgi:hypothetical protein
VSDTPTPTPPADDDAVENDEATPAPADDDAVEVGEGETQS